MIYAFFNRGALLHDPVYHEMCTESIDRSREMSVKKKKVGTLLARRIYQ